MALPLKLVVTGLKLDADLVMAYTPSKRRGSGGATGHRVHLSIVDEPGPKSNNDTDEFGDGVYGNGDHAYDSGYEHANHAAAGRASIGQRILPELHIESEIGHADAHVLRNVGKIERFIAEAVRKTLVDELVFPNFHTIGI